MKGLILNLGEVSTEKIVDCIKDIAGSVSENDIVEIVLRPSTLEPMKESQNKMKKQQPTFTIESSQFLLKGEAREDCRKICEVFDEFITGPGLEGREIKELTESYQQFYSVMQIAGLDIQDKKRLESALSVVAIESEMQGFIYGFRMFQEIMMRRIPKIQEITV